MISSELPEIVGMSDRVVVMREGEVSGVLERDEINEAAIVRLSPPTATLPEEAKGMTDMALPNRGRARLRRMVASNAGLLIVLALLVLMLLIGAVVSDRFRTFGNVSNVFEQSTELALVSLGQTLAVLTGGIDLAVGSLISLIICLTAGLLDGNATYLYPVIAGMLVLGALIGLVNGLGVVFLRSIPSS